MLNSIDIIDEHIIIRETAGYNIIKKIDLFDLPNVINFLKLVYNYKKMINVIKSNDYKD